MVLPKGGRKLPGSSRGAGDYAEVLAAALRAEFGDRRHMVKIIMRWTGASGRTVRYWLAAETVPNGNHLVGIIARSDHVLETVLAASRRIELLDAFIRMRSGPPAADAHVTSPTVSRPTDGRGGHDPDRGPDGTDPVPDRHRPAVSDGAVALNDRQLWFVGRLVDEPNLDAVSLAERFGVSTRTAKRDIAALKTAAEIRFVGNRRRGRYMLPEC